MTKELHYGLFDLVQPALMEIPIYTKELLASVPLGYFASPYGIKAALLAGFAPQFLTYLLFRGYEIFRPNAPMTDLIRIQKPSVIAQLESIDSIVDDD